MLTCQKCGWQDPSANFCEKCGGTMFEVLGSEVGAQGAQSGAEKKFLKFFMEPTEQFICALGNNFLQNFLTNGGIRKGFAAVSDKRVYFKGSCFSSDGGKYKLVQEERVVDVKDVTGTGYTRILRLSVLFKALIPLPVFLFLALIASLMSPALLGEVSSALTFAQFLFSVSPIINIVIAIAVYLSKRLNLFEIQFAGGKIAFDTKWYDKSEVDDFQRQIRLAKDSATSNAEPFAQMAQILQQTVAAPTATAQSSAADELKKFADLLAQGAITQDEYNQAKTELLKR